MKDGAMQSGTSPLRLLAYRADNGPRSGGMSAREKKSSIARGSCKAATIR
jgi:hypothetical protein